MKTRKIAAQMKDEYGRAMYSEKPLDMMFTNGKLTRVANQFGNGVGRAAAEGASAAETDSGRRAYLRLTPSGTA
jgi:hypothetical protein